MSQRVALRSAVSMLAGVGLIFSGISTTSAEPGNLPGTSAAIKSVTLPSKTLSDRIIPGRYIVKLSTRAVGQGATLSAVKGSQNTVESSASKAGIKFSVQTRIRTAGNMIVVRANADDANRFANLPGVAAVYPVLRVDNPAKPEMAYAKDITGVTFAQDTMGYTGDGIKVAVIDSGIDYNHPDLGGSGVNDETLDFPNSRVKGGTDLVGDAYDANVEGSLPAPDAFPDDCGGHGTHVSGIVGANGQVVGVAPEADLYAFRVFGCDGSSDNSVIMDAMNRAMEQGVDVVNMSLGSSFATWPQDPEAQLVDTMTEAGIAVVISAGNSGTGGLFSSGTPGVAHSAITVASSENTMITAPIFTVTGVNYQYIDGNGAKVPTPLSGTGELALPQAGNELGCNPITSDVAGKIVVIKRGACAFTLKATNAQNAGAAALVIYNNQPGTISPLLDGITIPVATVTLASGQAIVADILDGGATLTWTDDTESSQNPAAGLISDFSSWGLAADLTLKPDVTAPGGNIWSTYPLELKGYDNLSGTSMAAPHVTGVVALLMQARPDLKGHPLAIRDLLQNTAEPMSALPVARQGAGIVDVPDAILSAVTATPGKISLGDINDGANSTIVTLTNAGVRPLVYTFQVQNAPAVKTGTNIFGSNVTMPVANPTVTFSSTTITVPGKNATTGEPGTNFVNVTVTEPSGVEAGLIYGGYIIAHETSDGDDIRIPFVGMAGDYQMIDPVTYAGVDSVEANADTAEIPFYTMQGEDVPWWAYINTLPVSDLYIDIYHVDGLGEITDYAGTLGNTDYMGRTNPAGYLGGPWDGNVWVEDSDEPVAVANGRYAFVFTTLHAMGNPATDGHVSQVASDPFFIGTHTMLTNLTPPTFSPNAAVGRTLTVTPGTWQEDVDYVDHIWLVDGDPVADGLTYVVQPEDAGKTLQVIEIAWMENGWFGEAASVEQIVMDVFTTQPWPTLTGNAVFDQTLTINAGTWVPTPDLITYIWLRDGVVIPGATASTYKLTVADIDHQIKGQIVVSKAGYAPVRRNTASTTPVVAATFTTQGTFWIMGTPAVGNTLAVKTAGWDPIPTSYRYMWYRNGVAIPGATARTYVPVAADKGTKVRVRVVSYRAGYTPVVKYTGERLIG